MNSDKHTVVIAPYAIESESGWALVVPFKQIAKTTKKEPNNSIKKGATFSLYEFIVPTFLLKSKIIKIIKKKKKKI